MNALRLTYPVLLLVFCLGPSTLSGDEASLLPGGDALTVTLPLDEDLRITMTRFLEFSSTVLEIPLLFNEIDTDGLYYQFTTPVEVPKEEFQGYFERMLLEKSLLYIQSGDGPNALHRIFRIDMRAPPRPGFSAKTVPLADLYHYAKRGILISVTVPLEYINAREAMTSLNFFFQNQHIETIRPVENSNSLILNGIASKICGVVKTIRQMDVPPKSGTIPDWVTRVMKLEKRVKALEELVNAKKKE